MNLQLFFQALQALFNGPNSGVGTGVLGPLQPLLIRFIGTTSFPLTVDNPVVIGTWETMLAIADAFLLLLIIIGAIQMMISHSTGALTIPLSQFVPKVIVTALMMNLSYFFGRLLLGFNNALCEAVNANLNAFFNTINNGARVTAGQGLLLYLGVLLLLNLSLLRLLFQAFERLVLWILLFGAGPIAFLFALLPQTSSAFSYWARLFLVVTFTQFFQFLAFALGISLLASAGLNGLDGMFLAIAMLFLVAKVPDLLGRFPSMSIQGSQGVGRALGTIIVGARLLAA